MKVKITYKYRPELISPCIAFTMIDGEPFTRIGKTYEEAKIELICEIKKRLILNTVPDTETIEIKE